MVSFLVEKPRSRCTTSELLSGDPELSAIFRQGKRAEHFTQAIVGELVPAPTVETADASTLPPLPPHPIVENGGRPDCNLSDAGEDGGDSVDDEEGIESDETEQEEENDAPADGSQHTNGESQESYSRKSDGAQGAFKSFSSVK